MELINAEFKSKVTNAILLEVDRRQFINWEFYRHYGINEKVYLKMRKGEIENLLKDYEWLSLARKFGALENKKLWNAARTEVFEIIEEDILFCKQYSKAKICVDECGIGKTFAAKYLSKTLKNCFYVDASQGKTTLLFTSVLAKAIGLDCLGKYSDVKEAIKCYLTMIDNPVVIVDEAGDLSQNTLQEIKEYWNATEGFCGWYLMGADGLRHILEKGMRFKKPGFKEIFSRFSERYTRISPLGKQEKLSFYKKLISEVLSANMSDKTMLNEIVSKCLILDGSGHISGLRRAESLLLLHSNEPNLNTNIYEIEQECHAVKEA